MARMVKLREVCMQLEIDDVLLRELRDEGLIRVASSSSEEDEVSADEAERLRVIAVLMREMDVNLAGVEVILHMRQELLSMRRQFDDVVETLVTELRKQLTAR